MRTVEVTNWQKVRDSVLTVNPELTKIIDALDPGEDYPLIKAKYLLVI
jgi:hypothetical protein